MSNKVRETIDLMGGLDHSEGHEQSQFIRIASAVLAATAIYLTTGGGPGVPAPELSASSSIIDINHPFELKNGPEPLPIGRHHGVQSNLPRRAAA